MKYKGEKHLIVITPKGSFMTTIVTVEAHCSNDRQVEVLMDTGNGVFLGKYLQNGEKWEGYIFGDKTIKVEEIENVV